MRSLSVHLLAVFLALFGLIFLNTIGILSPVLDGGRLGVEFLISPVERVLEKIKDFLLIFIKLRDLSAENRILTQQVEKLSADLAVLEKAQQENRILREALGLSTSSKLELIPAEVIFLDQLNIDQKITINRGAKHGVADGSSVISPNGVLVGLVVSVLENTAQVELVTSSNFVVNAEILPGEATGLVRGEHGLGLLFDLISQNVVIKAGDRVVTSGLGGKFPKNLLIGEIGKIRSSESELFQKASVIPAANLKNLRLVFVVKNKRY